MSRLRVSGVVVRRQPPQRVWRRLTVVLIELTSPPTEWEAACVKRVIRVTSTTAKPKIHLGFRTERPISLYDMSDRDSDGMTMVAAGRKKRRTRTLTSA
jgi:hypothetical protein